MKKILAASVLLNLVLIFYIIKVRTAFDKVLRTPNYQTGRKKVLDDYTVYKNDIVFIGDSETQYFELNELINNSPLKNRGVQGEKTKNILNRINQIAAPQPKQIFIEVGINDLMKKVPIDSAVKNVDLTIKRVHQLSPLTNIYLEEIFPTSLVDSSTILLYNKRLQGLAKANGANFIPLYNIFNSGGKLKYDCGDHLHLTGNGYKVWTAILKPYLLVNH